MKVGFCITCVDLQLCARAGGGCGVKIGQKGKSTQGMENSLKMILVFQAPLVNMEVGWMTITKIGTLLRTYPRLSCGLGER